MKYYVIGDEDTVLGFGMVGVQGTVPDGADETKAAFDRAIDDREIGIIIITESAADLIRERVDRFLFSEQFPLLVEIPGRKGRKERRPGLRQLVNEAIGIKL
ncbi:MAG: V-type ATP synthase subunit F [Spirochaetia bacterium]